MTVRTPKPSHPMLEPLSHLPFRWYWIGQSISVLGDRISLVALPLLALELLATPVQLGQIAALRSLFEVLFLLLGGVVVDKRSSRTVMLFTDTLRTLLLCGLIVLMLNHALRLEHLYWLYPILGLCNAFFMPASSSILPQLLPQKLLVQGNALKTFSFEGLGIFGPILAGVLVTTGGTLLALSLDTLSFMVGISCLTMMRVAPKNPLLDSLKPPFKTELLEGFKIVASSAWLWVSIVVFSLINVCWAATNAILFPLFAKAHLGGAGALGWLYSSLGLGAVLAAVWMGKQTRLERRGIKVYGAVLIQGILMVVLASSHLLWVAALCCVGIGFSLVCGGIIWESSLQALVPSEKLGRVSSVDMLGSFALMPVGLWLVGGIVARVGLVPTFLGCGVGVALLGVLALCHPAIRKIN
jgi:MFS family permease